MTGEMNLGKTWTFDKKEVAERFNSHVRGQLPWYDLVISSLKMLAAHYLPPAGGVMYDIGASTGNLFMEMRDILQAREVRYVGIEKSREMVEQWRGDGDFETLLHVDALDHQYEPYDVAVLNLTMMFMACGEASRVVQAATRLGEARGRNSRGRPLPLECSRGAPARTPQMAAQDRHGGIGRRDSSKGDVAHRRTAPD